MNTLSKIEQEIIDDFKNQLKERLGDNLVSIQLFGSKARGDFHKESDIDLIVILRHINETNKDKVFEIVMQILSQYGIYLSVHIFSKTEYNHLNSIPTVFMQMVKRDAIKV